MSINEKSIDDLTGFLKGGKISNLIVTEGKMMIFFEDGDLLELKVMSGDYGEGHYQAFAYYRGHKCVLTGSW